MAFNGDAAPGEPIRRTAGDQEADGAQTLDNMLNAKYREWPNEAGFEGLREERGPIEIKVTGNIPTWAAGSLYRTGPGQSKVEGTVKGTYHISHWFDGLAHTHRFDIVPDDEHEGKVKVFYSSRRQSDDLVREIQKNGRHTKYTFAQRSDPCVGVFGKFMAAFHAALPRPESEVTENVGVALLVNPPGLVSVTSPPATVQGDNKRATNLGHRAAIPATMWQTTDSSSYRQIDPTTLEPIGFTRQSVLHPDLSGPVSCAHVQRDHETGDIFNYNLQFGRVPAYRIFRVRAATGETEILALVQRADVRPAYIHSFFLSPSFVVLCVPSSHMAAHGIKVAWDRNVLEALTPFDPSSQACKWIVVDRHGGRGVVAEMESPAGFFFHSVNAFEERDDQDLRDGTVSLFCDYIAYPTTTILYSLDYAVLMQRDGAADRFWAADKHRAEASSPSLVRHRARVPLSGRSTPRLRARGAVPVLAGPERIAAITTPHAGDLPTINPARSTRRHRYCYGLATRGLSTFVDAIVKTDVDSGEAVLWTGPAGHTPGEAVFVGRPGARYEDEDDGVLLSVVLDGAKAESYLLCLDARTMRELGRAEVGFAVGMGFHGHYSSL